LDLSGINLNEENKFSCDVQTSVCSISNVDDDVSIKSSSKWDAIIEGIGFQPKSREVTVESTRSSTATNEFQDNHLLLMDMFTIMFPFRQGLTCKDTPNRKEIEYLLKQGRVQGDSSFVLFMHNIIERHFCLQKVSMKIRNYHEVFRDFETLTHHEEFKSKLDKSVIKFRYGERN